MAREAHPGSSRREESSSHHVPSSCGMFLRYNNRTKHSRFKSRDSMRGIVLGLFCVAVGVCVALKETAPPAAPEKPFYNPWMFPFFGGFPMLANNFTLPAATTTPTPSPLPTFSPLPAPTFQPRQNPWQFWYFCQWPMMYGFPPHPACYPPPPPPPAPEGSVAAPGNLLQMGAAAQMPMALFQ